MPKYNDAQINISTQHKNQISSECIEFLLQGYSYSEIVEYLEISFNLTKRQAKYAIQEARVQILELGDFDLEMVIVQHVMNYEQATRFFDEIGNYSAKSAAMSAKERLLKIYEDETKSIEIENNLNINIDVDQLDYKIEKLDDREQNRINELFNKVIIST
jgi:hypothetical protein